MATVLGAIIPRFHRNRVVGRHAIRGNATFTLFLDGFTLFLWAVLLLAQW